MTVSLLSRLSDNHPQRVEDDYQWENGGQDTLIAELKMLFNSRARLPDIEAMPLVNASIINYGFNESFSNVLEISARRNIMEQRLRNTLARFEPRLTQVSLTSSKTSTEFISFMIQAMYRQQPVTLELKWDDCTGRFYFNE
ncbi:GPW/gp25 family protein [Pseudescherichia sp.]|uniref:type VI secretion system baseplate subunit TssE n=1 Tax=Pseudescherichia sp. TaxID=2055881 RepID=UPI00289C7205|nr:GPW/gp25 family protein [Pseudescherichia sp.]